MEQPNASENVEAVEEYYDPNASGTSSPHDADVEADFHEKDFGTTNTGGTRRVLSSSVSASHHGFGQHRVHVPLYSRPQQMQRWEQTASKEEEHSHVDWGGLFYDLFYVAAAYNLGSVYVSAIDDVNVQHDRPLFLYVIAAFGAIWMTWYNTVAYNARFTVLDYSHRILHVLRIVAISLSIVHIKSFGHFSNPLDPTMFSFLFGLLVESFINLFLWVEIWCLGRGGIEMKQEAKLTIALFLLPQVILYIVATSIAGNNCFSSSSNVDAETTNKNNAHRSLAEDKHTNDDVPSSSTAAPDDRPIWLVFAAYILYQLTSLVWSLYVACMKQREKYCVPVNVTYFIHRLGEWIMLMLGESVLSLLIVSLSDEQEYYIIVLVGVLTVVMLQDLHFESQPSDATAHAMARMTTGNVYVLLIQLSSLALIFLGASYKYLLDLLNYKVSHDDNSNGGYNNETVKEGSYPNERAQTDQSSHHIRLLGGSIVHPEDVQRSKEYVVWMYCLSLVFYLLFLELMLISHQGIIPWRRWLSLTRWMKEPLKHFLQALMLFLKIGIMASFAVYATNSTMMSFTVSYVTFFGGAIAFIFLFMRIIDWEFLQSDSTGERESNNDPTSRSGSE